MWGTSASNVWASGYGGVLLKWNGSSWTTLASGSSQALNAVWGTDAVNVWTVGSQGTVLQHTP